MEMQRENPDMMDQELAQALRMSQEQPALPPSQVSEEDEVQQAIALSLAAAGGVSLQGVGQGQQAQQAQGWGDRLARQQQQEEEMYREEQEKQAKEEEDELQKALAMSMEGVEESKPKLDPVQAGWPKLNKFQDKLPVESASKEDKSPQSIKTVITPGKVQPSTSKDVSSPKSTQQSSPSAMPEGPGNKLGGTSQDSVRGVRSAKKDQPKEDPAEIRRRRLAFLDKLQKSPPKNDGE